MAEASPQHTPFDTFYKAFVHSTGYSGQPWYEARGFDTCHALVQWQWNNNSMPSFSTMGQNQHAEINAIDDLNKYIKQQLASKAPEVVAKPRVVVKIYISWSPCSVCSKMLIQFKQRADLDLDIQMDVIFPTLYNIRRQSCLNDPTCSTHVDLIDKGESNANKEGLRQMARAGIALRTFTRDDWITVGDELEDNHEFIVFLKETKNTGQEPARSKEIGHRLEEDDRVARDLQAIL